MTEGGARLAAAFARAGRPIYIPYVMGGYPDLATSAAHGRLLGRHAGILELGVPFSDPLADGPTIQAAGQRALAAGTRPEDVIELAGELRDGPPVVLMTYVNPLLAAGPRAFFARAAAAGVAGVIVPDLPVDEGDDVRDAAARADVALVPLAAPTSDERRLAAVGRRAEGFAYCVAVAGVTGGESAVDARLADFLARARRAIGAPLAVGFGVRDAAQAARIGALADGVVVASQLIRLIDGADDPAAAERAIDELSASVVGALEALPSA